MSPSEFDLRAALHDGEGDGVDVDRLVLSAQAHVAQRRARLLSAASVVAVLVGGGVGVGLISSSGHDSGGAASTADGAQRVPQPGMEYAPASGSAGGSAGAALGPAPAHGGDLRTAGTAVACPATPPDYGRTATGGGASAAGTSLFGKTVSSVVVCAYGPDIQRVNSANTRPVRLELRDGAAIRLADSLESAPAAPAMAACEANLTQPFDFAFIGVTRSGARAGTLVARLPDRSCGGVVTNGDTVRFHWSPPEDIRKRLEALAAGR
jgi:hypothetical protein